MTDVPPALLHVHCSPELLNSLDQLIFVCRFDDSTDAFLQNQNTEKSNSWLTHVQYIQLYSCILHAMSASTRQARLVQLQRAGMHAICRIL